MTQEQEAWPVIKRGPQRPCQRWETAARPGSDNPGWGCRDNPGHLLLRVLDDTPRAGPPGQADGLHRLPCHKGNAISRNKGGSGVGGKSLAVGVGEDCASALHGAGVDDPPTFPVT